jgi:ferredoxin
MKLNLVYFSPTETTQKVLRMIADNLSTETTELDITKDGQLQCFTESDLVLMGIPVYSGRVPKLAKEKIVEIKGNNTPIILIATFGNRHYDDSLLELKNIVQANGFHVIAAAAFVTEHSVVPKFGNGRPDDNDINEIHHFAKLIQTKLASLNEAMNRDFIIKGNSDYREYKTIPIRPHTNHFCVKCGLCAKQCPAKAILFEAPKKTDKKKCVTCMRCIHICPQKARGFYSIEKFFAERSLAKKCREYKHSEIFI